MTIARLLAVARYAGFAHCARSPRARGSALGYMLSPATRVLHIVCDHPGLADSPWATCFRPLRGFCTLCAITQGSRIRPGLHAFARYAGCPVALFPRSSFMDCESGSALTEVPIAEQRRSVSLRAFEIPPLITCPRRAAW